MRKFAVVTVASLFVVVVSVSALSARSSQKSQEPTEWIANNLKEIEKVTVDMTRADLFKVFTTEGGLSTGLKRVYVYRKCPYIKVDVEFEPVDKPARGAEGRVTLIEADEDVIKKISKPYLEWSILD